MSSASPTSKPWIAHVVPYVAWIFFMQVLGDPAGWKYALRAVAGLAAFLWLKPWTWSYPRLNPRNLPAAFAIGVFVFLFWIAPQTDLAARVGWLHRGYLTFGILPPWRLEPPLAMVRYAPETDGWFFAMTRLLGSALVISFIEEFFWRGWMTRWIDREEFLAVDPPAISRRALWIGAILFASTHSEWLAALACGLVYGEFYRRSRDVWAVGIAHAVTNGLLGVYVLMTGKYEFWA